MAPCESVSWPGGAVSVNRRKVIFGAVSAIVVSWFLYAGSRLMMRTDTRSRRKAAAAHIQELARNVRANRNRAESLAELETLASGDYSFVAVYALITIGELGELGVSAVPVLAGELRDDRPAVREAAANALDRMGPHASAARSQLVEAVRERVSEGTAVFSAMALGNSDPGNSDVIAALEYARTAKNSMAVDSATRALEKIRARMKCRESKE